MKNTHSKFAIVFACFTSLCSGCQNGLKESEHDGAAGGTTSTNGSAENVFLGGQDGVIEVFVDGSRIYWVTVAMNDLEPPASFRSCLKDHCSTSITTYLEDRNEFASFARSVAIDSTNVYWFRGIYNETTSAVLSCPLSGCPSKPTTVIESLAVNSLTSMVSDGTFLYWTSPGQTSVLRCKLDNCKPTIEALAQTQSNPESLVVSAGYAYWVASEGQASYAVRRVSVDGTSQVETIATGQNQTTSLTVREPYVYFNNNIEAGTISACPVTGCDGSPTIIASGLKFPTSVVADSTNVYWINTGDSMLDERTSLGRCHVSGCESPVPPIATFVSFWVSDAHGIALDDNYVYWADMGVPEDASRRDGFPGAAIYRIAK